MPGCLGCPPSNSTDINNVWADFRNYYGPTLASMSSVDRDALRTEDLGLYLVWAIEHDISDPTNNYNAFKRWFSWKLMVGTNSGGNLPERIRDHVGLNCAKCPYDTNCDDIRAENMIGYVPSNQTDHGIYYMKIEGHGSVWGFRCTYLGCPYLADTGRAYFYV